MTIIFFKFFRKYNKVVRKIEIVYIIEYIYRMIILENKHLPSDNLRGLTKDFKETKTQVITT